MPRRRPIRWASASSARNRFVGLVTKVTADQVMAEVQMQCGPFTVVSLMSTESAARARSRAGRLAVAVVKATTVIVETPGGTHEVDSRFAVAASASPRLSPAARVRTPSRRRRRASSRHVGAHRPATITVFAAASLKSTFTDSGTQFEKDNPGTKVTFNFAGSSDLVTQLTAGRTRRRVRLR